MEGERSVSIRRTGQHFVAAREPEERVVPSGPADEVTHHVNERRRGPSATASRSSPGSVRATRGSRRALVISLALQRSTKNGLEKISTTE